MNLASAPITDDGIGAFIVLSLIFLVSFVGWLRNRRAYGDDFERRDSW